MSAVMEDLEERGRRALVMAPLAAAEKARRSFRAFIPYIWKVLEPGVEYQGNWHIDAIADHLEAVHKGQILRLIINIPFRMLKSTLVSQMFPAYEWLHLPSTQYLTASYAKDLATRDAVNSRRIIDSELYQRAMALGDSPFEMTTDQNVKTRYENSKRGHRIITSTDSAATGFGGGRLIVDDPISALMADSELEVKKSVEWWKGTMTTRFNDISKDAAIVTHQRLNQQDLTGYLLAEEGGWEHLVLPMMYDRKIISLAKPTSLGYKDPRTVQGHLLMPQRLNSIAVRMLKKSLGKYHTNAQLQQNPSPRSGIIFKRDDWRYYNAVPPVAKLEIVLSIDCTFKELDTSDDVSLQTWGAEKLPGTGLLGSKRYLLDRAYGKMGIKATMQAIRNMKAKWPTAVAVLVEDKANGTAVVELLEGEISGLIAVTPQGGKESRALSCQPAHEAHDLYVPNPLLHGFPWVNDYIENMTRFPGTPDDDTDATSQALTWYRTRENYKPASPQPATGGSRTMT